MERRHLTRFAWLSISAAIVTMGLKTVAYLFTGSVGLLSDALESLVNLVGGLMALAMLTVAARPPDEDHPYGHSKAEYFSSGRGGDADPGGRRAASRVTAVAAPAPSPQPLEQVWHWAGGIGRRIADQPRGRRWCCCGRARCTTRSRSGQRSSSADRRLDLRRRRRRRRRGGVHRMAFASTRSWRCWSRRTSSGPASDREPVGVRPHGHRASGGGAAPRSGPCWTGMPSGRAVPCPAHPAVGARRFISVHVLVPGDVDGASRVTSSSSGSRRTSASVLPNVTVFTHLESLDDPASWDDMNIDRPGTM